LFLGIGSYTFPWAIEAEDSIEGRFCYAKKLLEYAAENNIRFVQFGDNLPLHEWSSEQLNEFKTISDRLSIQIQAGTRKLLVEHIRLYISIASRFGSPFLRVVIDDKDFHPSPQEVIRQIKMLLPDLQNSNVILGIENHDRFSAITLEEIILATDAQLVGICLDTANSLGAGEGIESVMKILAPYTINLHVKDFIIQRVEHKMGFIVEGAAAGEGMLDIPSLISVLQKHQRCETITLELWSNREKDLKTTVMEENRKVERSIHYLKKVLA
jgi:sugar phosphate isomerase/epimerase